MSAVAEDVSAFLSANRGKLRTPIPTSPIGFDAFLRNGVPVSVAAGIADRYGLTRQELGALLHVSPSTLDRRFEKQGKFVGAEADAMYRLLGTLGVAMRVLKTDENVVSWLHRGQPALRGEQPINLLRTNAGAEAINLLLEQMYHGIVP
ncbi:MAG TPA: antitoxin Xre-like helix-turn-helix domain-containing protein [Rhodanobacteraceae bacterium]|nr:antitoxin Xre-like helix-turn-helix domain-containing protein [Rhodanobacteraceae bacterium]